MVCITSLQWMVLCSGYDTQRPEACQHFLVIRQSRKDWWLWSRHHWHYCCYRGSHWCMILANHSRKSFLSIVGSQSLVTMIRRKRRRNFSATDVTGKELVLIWPVKLHLSSLRHSFVSFVPGLTHTSSTNSSQHGLLLDCLHGLLSCFF